MSKFEANDRFFVKENGLLGQIICVYSVSVDSMESAIHYNVLWDHHSQWVSYASKDVDDLWEKNIVVKLPHAIDFIPITIDLAGLEIAENELKRKAGCDHKRVNAGFHFNNFVCYHCGISMP